MQRSKKTVLLVDEVDLSIELHKSFLRTAQLNLLTATDGNAALSLVRAAPPDLIFLGLNLEGIDGAECCRRIKQDPALAHIPVIMLALSPSQDVVKELIQAGSNDILYKPISRRHLYETTRNFLGAHLWTEPRRQVQAEVALVMPDGERCISKIFDFSSGGLFLETRRQIPVGTQLQLELPSPGAVEGPFRCSATVAWHNAPGAPCKPSYPVGLGVEFSQLSAAERQRLETVLVQLSAD